jgi:hypothetical protein
VCVGGGGGKEWIETGAMGGRGMDPIEPTPATLRTRHCRSSLPSRRPYRCRGGGRGGRPAAATGPEPERPNGPSRRPGCGQWCVVTEAEAAASGAGWAAVAFRRRCRCCCCCCCCCWARPLGARRHRRPRIGGRSAGPFVVGGQGRQRPTGRMRGYPYQDPVRACVVWCVCVCAGKVE